MEKIGIITVLYNSKGWKPFPIDENAFHIVVDNTPNRDLNLSSKNVKYLPLKKNVGIAAAQNLGIEFAVKQHLDYIIFFDQDSIVDNEIVTNLSNEFNRIELIDPNIIAIGPNLIEIQSGLLYKGNLINENASKIETIISSGMYVKISKLLKVGLMDSNLFIDYVDHEWCWRAAFHGYTIYKTPKVQMQHQVGLKQFKCLGISFIISSPIRYFYSFRNFRILLFRHYVPIIWKIKTLIKKCIIIFSILFIKQYSGQKWLTLKYSLKGIFCNQL